MSTSYIRTIIYIYKWRNNIIYFLYIGEEEDNSLH